MNKLIVILLAVCLVSAHAFVKRDTATAETTQSEILPNIQENLQKISDELSKVFAPDQIKKGFNDIVDQINEAVNKLKPDSPAKQ